MALVSVLAGGDYLLWNWSLKGSHDVLALMSGLTLTPLVIALIWLLALNGVRLLAWLAQRRRAATTTGGASSSSGSRRRGRLLEDLRRATRVSRRDEHSVDRAQAKAEEAKQTSSSSKLAA